MVKAQQGTRIPKLPFLYVYQKTADLRALSKLRPPNRQVKSLRQLTKQVRPLSVRYLSHAYRVPLWRRTHFSSDSFEGTKLDRSLHPNASLPEAALPQRPTVVFLKNTFPLPLTSTQMIKRLHRSEEEGDLTGGRGFIRSHGSRVTPSLPCDIQLAFRSGIFLTGFLEFSSPRGSRLIWQGWSWWFSFTTRTPNPSV